MTLQDISDIREIKIVYFLILLKRIFVYLRRKDLSSRKQYDPKLIINDILEIIKKYENFSNIVYDNNYYEHLINLLNDKNYPDKYTFSFTTKDNKTKKIELIYKNIEKNHPSNYLILFQYINITILKIIEIIKENVLELFYPGNSNYTIVSLPRKSEFEYMFSKLNFILGFQTAIFILDNYKKINFSNIRDTSHFPNGNILGDAKLEESIYNELVLKVGLFYFNKVEEFIDEFTIFQKIKEIINLNLMSTIPSKIFNFSKPFLNFNQNNLKRVINLSSIRGKISYYIHYLFYNVFYQNDLNQIFPKNIKINYNFFKIYFDYKYLGLEDFVTPDKKEILSYLLIEQNIINEMINNSNFMSDTDIFNSKLLKEFNITKDDIDFLE